MILVKPRHEILTVIDGADILRRIEGAGRVCYKTEDEITEKSAAKFVEARLKQGHESVIEHESISVRIICDRGVTHEIVRHRLCAYSQESTRYCNYKGGVTFVIPPWLTLEEGEWTEVGSYILPPSESHYDSVGKYEDETLQWWLKTLFECENRYGYLIAKGWSPQQARSVLPNSLKTEIVMTANIREWRHILKLRTSKAAHPQMQEVMIPILEDFQHMIPVLFDNI